MLDVGEAAIKGFALFSPIACIPSCLPTIYTSFPNPTSLTDILNLTEPHASFSNRRISDPGYHLYHPCTVAVSFVSEMGRIRTDF
jgi:hypothetical protein